MDADLPRIEDIADELTSDLMQKGFLKIRSEKNEILRYEKQNSAVRFQAGIKQKYTDEENVKLNDIYIVLDFDKQREISSAYEELAFPDYKRMRAFFRNTTIQLYGLSNVSEKYEEDARMQFCYHVGFEKISPENFKGVLREMIDYFCNYISANAQMFAKTEKMD
jgi:hypothetical protein